MDKRYIITAHDYPEQLKRMIDRLSDENSTFYIHVDLKSDITQFKNIVSNTNVRFINTRVDCIWGDISQVTATLNLLEVAMKDAPKNSMIIFISGQDYPIKSPKYIDAYLESHGEYDFLDYTTTPIPKDSDIYKTRVKKYKINLSSQREDFVILDSIFSFNPGNLKTILQLLVKGKLRAKDFFMLFNPKRKSIFKEHYKGTNWFCLTRATLEKIMAYLDLHKDRLLKYYRYTLCPDEQIFHTILHEIMKEDKTIKLMDNLHFVDWERKNVPLPVTFSKEDKGLLLDQPEHKLFARKFRMDVDGEILDLIDQKVESRSVAP